MRLNYPPLLTALCYVDGRWTAAEDGASVPETNPTTGELIGHVAMLGRDAIELAVVLLRALRQITLRKNADKKIIFTMHN